MTALAPRYDTRNLACVTDDDGNSFDLRHWTDDEIAALDETPPLVEGDDDVREPCITATALDNGDEIGGGDATATEEAA